MARVGPQRHRKNIYIYIQGAYKLSEDFAKPCFHKYWTVVFRQGQCLRPTTSKNTTRIARAHQHRLRGFGGNGSIAWTSAVSQVGRTSNAFKVTMKLQTFLSQMVVTSCISVQYLWKYGFAKSSDNLYAPCIYIYIYVIYGIESYMDVPNLHRTIILHKTVCEMECWKGFWTCLELVFHGRVSLK